MTAAAQEHHRRTESCPKTVSKDLGRNLRPGRVATADALAAMGLMFGNVSGDGGQFGNLRPDRLGIIGARFRGQNSLAFFARLWNIMDDFLDSFRRQTHTRMPAMARLSAGLTPAVGLG